MSKSYYQQFLEIVAKEPDQYHASLQLNEEEISKLINEIQMFDYSKPEQLMVLAAFIHFGQKTIGTHFADVFNPRETWKAKVLEKLRKKLSTENNLPYSRYERHNERIWRLNVYKGLSSHLDGFDSYLNQSSSLLYETEHFVPESVCYILDAIALLSPEVFTIICKESQNPLWSLRWYDRLHNINSNHILNINVYQGLPLSHQGILSAYLWNDCLKIVDKEDFLFTAKNLLRFHMMLPNSLSLPVLARVLSNLTTKRFSSLTRSDTRVNYEWQLENLLDLAAKEFETLPQVVKDEAVDFIAGFYNSSNGEPIWACLELAKRLKRSPDLKKTSRLLQQIIISKYPSYWETSGARTHYSLSEELTTKLITELAIAMITCYKETAFEFIKDYKDIPTLDDLNHLKDVHDYHGFFEARKLLFVHAFLASQLLRNYTKEKSLINEKWEGFFDFVLRLTMLQDETKDGGITKGIKRDLFTVTSSLLVDYGYHTFYDKWLCSISDPLDLLAVIKGNISFEKKMEIFKRIEKTIPYYLAALRDKEILDIGLAIYSLENFSLAAYLLSQLDYQSLSKEQVALWKRLISISFLNAAYVSENENAIISNMKAALKYSQQSINEHFDPYKKENVAVTVQLIGWLFDRGEASYSELFNAYNLIASHNWKGENDLMRPEDYYIRSLTLVRLLSVENSDPYHIEEMKNTIHKMSDIPGQQLTQVLLHLWYDSFTGKPIYDKNLIIEKQQEIREYKAWLPTALQKVFEEIVNESV